MAIINLEQLQHWLTDSLAARHRPIAGALASFAYVPADDGPKLVGCRWFFAEEIIEARPYRQYPTLILGEEWLPVEIAVEALIDILTQKRRLGPVFLSYDANRLWMQQQSKIRSPSYTGWTEDLVSISVVQNGVNVWGPVAARGLPPYADAADAVRDWVWHGAQFNSMGRELPFLGQVVVLLPDTRGRIRRAEWEGETLTVHAETTVADEVVELQVNAIDTGKISVIGASPGASVTRWDIPRMATAVQVFLVHGDGTLLSTVYLTRGEHYKAHVGELSLEERAPAELSVGEGDQIEYKPYIEHGDNKEWEVIQTIVAFLNTGGGRLYLGVTDDGVPQPETILRKLGKGDTDQALTALTARVHELIRSRIKPVPRVLVQAVPVAGARVIAVDVPPGDDRPYATAKNDIYIRKGASNFKPDPRTELASLFRKRNRSGSSTGSLDNPSVAIQPIPTE